MVFKWKEEHTPLFLEHFKKYSCLWNYRSESYKNRDLRANAIKSLIQDLNIDGVNEEDIKLKIKSVRTRYTCELSKINKSTKSGCSADDVYIPKLYWFKQADEFLNSVCVPRQSSSNFSISEQQRQVTVTENEETQGAEQETPESNSRRSSQANNDHSLDDTSRAPKCRKRRQDMPIDRAIKQLKAISDNNKENTTENEFDLFSKSLALQLKNMPLHRALICQQKLQSVMVQERLQFITTGPQPVESNIQSPNYMRSPSQRSYTYVYSPPSPLRSSVNLNIQSPDSIHPSSQTSTYIISPDRNNEEQQIQSAPITTETPHIDPPQPYDTDYEPPITIEIPGPTQQYDQREYYTSDLLETAIQSIL